MPRKVITYRDPWHDDFAGTHIVTKPLYAGYRYVRTNPVWRACACFVYRGLARPVALLFRKLWCCQRFENRKALDATLDRGIYVYANHTQKVMDAFLPCQLRRGGRSYIVVGPDTMSIPCIHNLVQMLGAIPLGSTLGQSREMTACVHGHIAAGDLVAIYPEAHIWPFYTGIRSFSEASFGYPARDGAPVYTMTSCYQKRRFGPFPKVVTYLDGPFYPDEALPLPQRKKALRDACQKAMEARAKQYSTYAYYEYRREDA
ncbi:MAG: hypothetical protein SOZ90_06885 [Candidatus Faecousia sp.]|nr:hypothetical protein [Candidatus Faecousia sp.]